jgi:hypothetical protein
LEIQKTFRAKPMDFLWPQFDERNAAAPCYASSTTSLYPRSIDIPPHAD